MKTKNIPPDIKSKSINEAKSEIMEILQKLESNDTNFETCESDYKRLLSLNHHVNLLLKEKLNKIQSKGKKK